MNFKKIAALSFKVGRSMIIQNETNMLKAGLKTSVLQRQKVKYSPLDPKLKRKMEAFQVEDGVPIHLKGGLVDVLLYVTTLAACAAGLLGSFDYIYHSSVPKKEASEC